MSSVCFCSRWINHQVFKSERSNSIEPAVVESKTHSYSVDEVLLLDNRVVKDVILLIFLDFVIKIQQITCLWIMYCFCKFVALVRSWPYQRIVDLISNFNESRMRYPASIKPFGCIFKFFLLCINNGFLRELRLAFTGNESANTSNGQDSSSVSNMDDLLGNKFHEMSVAGCV